ncbi:MAG: Xaa-Pro dipeptidase [Steroidobacteraceae bacterium]
MNSHFMPSGLDEAYAAHLATTAGAIDQALEALQLQGLAIHAGRLHEVFLDDQSYPFRPNPWFLWLAPLADAPDSLILWEPGRRPRLILVVPEDYWHLPPAPPTDPWVQHFALEIVATAEEALARLPAAPQRWAWLGEPAPPPGWQQVNPAPLRLRLEQARCRKTEYELLCMREASRLGVAGHRAAERAFRAGGSEFAIHLAFLGASGMTDPDLPYASIVGLNEHAATLHYQHRDRQTPVQHRCLLIDAGAAFRGYASDITRTWAGTGMDLFRDLVDGMERMQQGLCAEVRAGVEWPALHLAAHRGVARLLRAAGVLRVGEEQALDSGLTRAFLPHGLGHLLGLQVHDVGGFHPAADAAPLPPPAEHRWLRLTRRLEPGFVVTVEPGIYFIPMLLAPLRAGSHAASVDWQLVDLLAPCGGIRIEDNVVVTADGHHNLTREAFASA